MEICEIQISIRHVIYVLAIFVEGHIVTISPAISAKSFSED